MRIFRECLSICICFGTEGGKLDMIVLVPNQCIMFTVGLSANRFICYMVHAENVRWPSVASHFKGLGSFL